MRVCVALAEEIQVVVGDDAAVAIRIVDVRPCARRDTSRAGDSRGDARQTLRRASLRRRRPDDVFVIGTAAAPSRTIADRFGRGQAGADRQAPASRGAGRAPRTDRDDGRRRWRRARRRADRADRAVLIVPPAVPRRSARSRRSGASGAYVVDGVLEHRGAGAGVERLHRDVLPAGERRCQRAERARPSGAEQHARHALHACPASRRRAPPTAPRCSPP